MTTRQLKTLAKLWQSRLQLTHWAIKVSFKSAKEMGDKVGGVQYMPEHATAYIEILKTRDRKEKDDTIEEDIIHELLHLVISGHRSKQEKYDELFERGINAIATALVKGYK